MSDDTVGATIGDTAQGVAVGKDIVMVSVGDGTVRSESDKLDEMYRLLCDIDVEVAVLRTRLSSLAIGLALVFTLMIWRLF